MTHTVTITKLPDEESDDYEYTFGGEHGPDCEVYVRCKRKACQAMSPDYRDERERHGRHHFFRDGEWLAASDQCALRYVFEDQGAHETFENVPIGTYPVRIEWDDYSWWIEVQAPRVPAEAVTA